MSDNMIVDVSLDNFKQLVIEASFDKAVLIDFWADWCEPCKTLTPLLEKVVAVYQGQLILAKVDCEAEQELVAHFGVRNLPTVVLFKDGQLIDGFTGNQAEAAIKEMLAKHVTPPPTDEQNTFKQAEVLYKQGQVMEAEQLLKQLLATDNSKMLALILYARCLAQRGELAESETILDSIAGEAFKEAVATAKVQLMFLKQAKELPDEATLQVKLATDPTNDELTYQLAIVLLASQHYELAMETLLNLFKRNKSYQEDLPRKTLVQLFDLLGNDHPLVTLYCRKLYQALY